MKTIVSSGISWLLRAIPLVIFLACWHVVTVGDPQRRFFLGSPGLFFGQMYESVVHQNLLGDVAVTALEAALGFAIGNLAGASLGLAAWNSRFAFWLVRPYVIMLGSAPLLALAPVIVLWFGTGLMAKVFVAAFSTFFVALMQAFRGAEEADRLYVDLLRSMGASQWEVFKKAVVPSALAWVAAAFQINAGLALLGAFLGEYISSEKGLGHLILVAGGLYNIPLVLVGVASISVMGTIFTIGLGRLERPILRLVVRFF